MSGFRVKGLGFSDLFEGLGSRAREKTVGFMEEGPGYWGSDQSGGLLRLYARRIPNLLCGRTTPTSISQSAR